MTKIYTSIPITPLLTGCSFSQPHKLPEVAHLNDPAITIMTDFKIVKPITIFPDAPLSEATMEMKVCNVHMLFVVDKSQKVIGIITSEDLLGEKPLKVSMTRHIKRSEVLVRMVMIQLEK